MILGIGTDIVAVARIADVLAAHPERFVARILAPAERAAFVASPHPARHLAKRFAAKEATGKALGTGIGAGVSWHDIQIRSDASGRPQLDLGGPAAARLAAPAGIAAHLSLSDENDYAVAFVVLESVADRASQL